MKVYTHCGQTRWCVTYLEPRDLDYSPSVFCVAPVLVLVDGPVVGGSDGGTGPESVCVFVQQEREEVVIKSCTVTNESCAQRHTLCLSCRYYPPTSP